MTIYRWELTPSMTMRTSSLDLAAQHAGISTRQARQAITSALRSLHQIAVTDRKGLTAVATECRFNFGPEACFHLFGLLELQRLVADPELPWSETLLRMDPQITKYRALLDVWLANGGDPEPLHTSERGDRERDQ